MSKQPKLKTGNKPCAQCKGRVTVLGTKGGNMRVCDKCGFTERDN